MVTATKELIIHRRSLKDHPHQAEFVESTAKRIVVRAGRRGGKTVGAARRAVAKFLSGMRYLYTAPTSEQTEKFWFEVKRSLQEPIDAGVFKCNESEKYIERARTEQRIKAKTAWNADTLRGDYADEIAFDEYQLTNEDAWEVVGAPMLLDNNGDALFIYTPPSLRSAGISKARDPRHAAKMFKAAQADTTGRWQAIHFTSFDNPHISREALREIIKDMSKQSYRQEILAEDDEIQLSWLVYKAFNEVLRKIPRFEIPKSWPVYSGHDFGSANPAALFFGQVKLPLPSGASPEMRYGDLVAFREYLPGAGYATPQHVGVFKGIAAGYSVVESRGGSHQEDGNRSDYGAHGWTILEPKHKEISVQIDRVIGLFELNKVWVFNDLYGWLEELMNCLWIPDNEGRPTNKIKDEAKWHLCSCARYLLSSFTPETVTSGIRKQPVSYI